MPVVGQAGRGAKGVTALKGINKGSNKNVPTGILKDVPYSKDFVKQKMETAKTALGKTKVPVFYREKLATNSTDINTFGMEVKPLSEISPQMFSVKGVAREIKEINKEAFGKAMVEAARSQPKYTRKPNKPRNFKNKIRNEDGTTSFTFISNKNGKEYNVTYDKDGFPLFNSKFEDYLPEKLYLETDAIQFEYLSRLIYKEIQGKPI